MENIKTAENGCAADKSAERTDTKQASSKQLIAIVFILALATKMFLLPISLIRDVGRDGYIVLAIGAGADLITLIAAIAAIKLSPDTDFFTLMRGLFGKVGSKTVVAFIALFLFFKLNIAVTETLAFYTDSVFGSFDASIMLIILLAFLVSVANHTLRALCRLNELTVPLIVLGIAVLAAIVLATGADLGNILPAAQRPAEMGDAMLRHAAWIGDFSPLVLFIGRTKLKKHTAAFAAASGTLGAAVTVFFAIVMCAAFGNVPLFADSSTNISNIVQFSLGNVYGRIDLFSAVLWSVAAFVETALFFYATCRCIAYVIGKNAHLIIGLCVSVALYFIQVFAMTDPVIFSTVVSSPVTSMIALAYTVAIPVLAVIGAVKGKNGRKEDGK